MKPTLGEFLKRRIEEIPKMSIRNLERKSGVSNSEICKIINGTRKNPNPHLLKSIAQSLKVDYKFLYYLVDYIDAKEFEWIEEGGLKSNEAFEQQRTEVRKEAAVYSHPQFLAPDEQELLDGFRSIIDNELRSDILRHLKLALRVEGRL